jgi:hypothetical protein
MEILMVRAQDTSPTLPEILNPAKLWRIDPYFRDGRHSELEPATLLKTSAGLLVFNGHHRLALGMIYDIELRSRVSHL